MEGDDTTKEEDNNTNLNKIISNRVNKILNDKNYLSTDDMNNAVIYREGNCIHEIICPKSVEAKRNL